MDEHLKVDARALDDEKIAALCREFAISRMTGQKIISRNNDSGRKGLTERSRHPFRHANLPRRPAARFSSRNLTPNGCTRPSPWHVRENATALYRAAIAACRISTMGRSGK